MPEDSQENGRGTAADFRRFENFCVAALVRREYSRAELAGKALPEIAPDIVHAVLDKLQEAGYQSDARFCESTVRGKANKGDGPLKIRQALRQKGVADGLIKDAMAQIDWFEIAAGVYAKKYREPAATPAERAKRQRFMAQRGFGFDEIREAERTAFDDESND